MKSRFTNLVGCHKNCSVLLWREKSMLYKASVNSVKGDISMLEWLCEPT